MGKKSCEKSRGSTWCHAFVTWCTPQQGTGEPPAEIALERPRQLFAAARNSEEAGSLTIIEVGPAGLTIAREGTFPAAVVQMVARHAGQEQKRDQRHRGPGQH